MNDSVELPGMVHRPPKPETQSYIAVSTGVETRAIVFVFPPNVVVLTSPNSTSAQTLREAGSGTEDSESNGEGEFIFVDPYRSKYDGSVADVDGPNYSIDQETEAFLGRVYDLESKGQARHAIDVIFQHMNSLLMERRFDDCNEILRKTELRRISPMLMAAFLTITAAARKELKNRPVFFENVRLLVEAERGPEDAKRLLVGLR